MLTLRLIIYVKNDLQTWKIWCWCNGLECYHRLLLILIYFNLTLVKIEYFYIIILLINNRLLCKIVSKCVKFDVWVDLEGNLNYLKHQIKLRRTKLKGGCVAFSENVDRWDSPDSSLSLFFLIIGLLKMFHYPLLFILGNCANISSEWIRKSAEDSLTHLFQFGAGNSLT